MQKPFVNSSFEEALATVRGGRTTAASLNTGCSPSELHEIYSKGFRGVRPDKVTPDERKAFGDMMAAQPGLYEVFPWAKGIGKGKACAAYLPQLHFDENFGGDEAQTVGSCFLAGTQVRMGDGSLRPIEQVGLGDQVVTHLGNVKTVTNLIEKPHNGHIVELAIEGCTRKLKATPEHKFIQYPNLWDTSIKNHDSRHKRRSEVTEWKRVDSLVTGDYVLLPNQTGEVKEHTFFLDEFPECYSSKNLPDRIEAPSPGKVRCKNGRYEVNREIPLDTRLAWVLGLYAAEGGVQRGGPKNHPRRTTFTLCSAQKDAGVILQLKSFLKDLFGDDLKIEVRKPKESVISIRVNSIPLGYLLSSLVTGNVYSKRTPWQLMTSSPSVRAAFVKGWLDGDGHLNTKRRPEANSNYCSVTGVSVSRGLLEDVFDILVSLGYSPKLTNRKARKQSKKAGQVNLYGSDVMGLYPDALAPTRVKRKHLKTRLGLAAKVKSVTAEPFTGTVYCLEVEDDHSFIAEGFAVHNCVSHSTANAAAMDYCADALWGETMYKGRIVKEAMYKARGYNSHGWYCGTAASYIGPEGDGGLLYRKEYGEGRDSIDLSEFSRDTERWASSGSRGCPAWLEKLAAKNKAQWIIPINGDLDVYRDAIALGFGVSICSGYGYSNSTDSNGVARQQGSWGHAMAHTAFNDTKWAHDTYGGMLGGVQQSWGRWNRINGTPEGSPKMATGMFYARGRDVGKMIKGSDDFAICGVQGWDRIAWQDLVAGGSIQDRKAAMVDHFKDSTISDYYKERQEKGFALVDSHLDGGSLLAI